MKFLNTTKRSRLKFATYFGLALFCAGIYAINQSMEGVATTCFAGVLTIATILIGGETYRPSVKEDNE